MFNFQRSKVFALNIEHLPQLYRELLKFNSFTHLLINARKDSARRKVSNFDTLNIHKQPPDPSSLTFTIKSKIYDTANDSCGQFNIQQPDFF